MNLELTDLREEDLKQVKDIYDHYILNTTATFFTNKLTIKELKEMIKIGHPKYKSFLIYYENSVCGFCYFSRYKNRPAYDRTAEITVYLKPGFTGRGIGLFTLKEMEKLAGKSGFRVLIGIISADNKQSVALAEKCGFEKCAHFKEVGEKFGKILDVVAYQKILDR
ncbi:MAG: N-acetyltransferase [Bacteroidales bacterium]|nr:N-acetyltransferase [Bacteroidales bacterium]